MTFSLEKKIDILLYISKKHLIARARAFDMLGRMLGYRIITEFTIKKLSETMDFSFPVDMGRKKIDMIWWRFLEKGACIELALESQQSSAKDEIVKDIKKLLSVPGARALLIFNMVDSTLPPWLIIVFWLFREC